MNYFALAGAVIMALLGANSVFSFIRVAFGKARWRSEWGPILNLAWAATAITVSAWLFGLAAG